VQKAGLCGAAMSGDHHEVRFQRNTGNGRHRAFCTCGWERFGTQEYVQSQAASHDLDVWIDEPAPQPERVQP
jgi:hypothetical protein